MEQTCLQLHSFHIILFCPTLTSILLSFHYQVHVFWTFYSALHSLLQYLLISSAFDYQLSLSSAHSILPFYFQCLLLCLPSSAVFYTFYGKCPKQRWVKLIAKRDSVESSPLLFLKFLSTSVWFAYILLENILNIHFVRCTVLKSVQLIRQRYTPSTVCTVKRRYRINFAYGVSCLLIVQTDSLCLLLDPGLSIHPSHHPAKFVQLTNGWWADMFKVTVSWDYLDFFSVMNRPLMNNRQKQCCK